MKLTFIYVPVDDLGTALAFYRDRLGFSEAWREGESTVAFELPGTGVQLMVSTDPGSVGPMYQVDSVTGFLADHPDLTVDGPISEIPDGSVAGVRDPAGNVVYVFDQKGAD